MDSADAFTGDTWLEQLFSVMETFSADSDDVYVCELVGLLPVVNTSNVAPFSLCYPQQTSLCGGMWESIFAQQGSSSKTLQITVIRGRREAEQTSVS